MSIWLALFILGAVLWGLWSCCREADASWREIGGVLLFLLWVVVLSLAAVSAVFGQEVCKRRCILPPAEYDKPYTGRLILETVPNQEELAKFCGKAYIPGLTLGCSQRRADSCKIVLVPDAIITMNGWTRALMLRHELGHCNGWPGDHPGARGVEDEAREKLINPVLRW